MEKSLITVLSLGVLVCFLIPGEVAGSDTWDAFKATFNKEYRNADVEAAHKAQFEANLKDIEAHNKRFDQGQETIQLGVTEFTDEHPADFSRSHKGLNIPADVAEKVKNHQPSSVGAGEITYCDWREEGVVSPIQNQYQCGDCWAFAAVASLESQVMRYDNKSFQPLSEEQVTDCAFAQGNMGCQGGWPAEGLEYLVTAGADSQKSYKFFPAKYGITGFCRSWLYTTVQNVSAVNQLKMPTDDATLAAYMCTNGPVAIAVDASKWSASYKTGVISCAAKSQADHAVTLVGASPEGWIFKNSWGTSWGQGGFGKIAYGSASGADCGVTQYTATYPTIPQQSQQ